MRAPLWAARRDSPDGARTEACLKLLGAARSESAAALKAGQRWRLGTNFWTTFETNTSLSFGSLKVDPGYYYVMLEKGPKDAWFLILLPAREAWKRTLDAFQAADTKGGLKVSLLSAKAAGAEAEALEIAFEPDAAADAATLRIRFGPHAFEAKFSFAR